MLIVSRALLGVAFRNARALHALPDPQHVYGPRPARPGHRGMGNQLLSGSGDWAARRWGAAGVLLVRVRVPARRACDGAAPRTRPRAAPGVPRSRSGPARPHHPSSRSPRPAGCFSKTILPLSEAVSGG